MKHFLFAAFVLMATPCVAQQVEVAGSTSFNTTASLDETAPGVDDLEIDGGWTFGARGAYFLTEHFGLEGFWNYQATSLDLSSGSSSGEVFDMTLNQVFGNVVYQFAGASRQLTPFVFGGVGATFFSADDLESESKFAWNVGAGVKWFLYERIGVEGRLRYRPTELRDESSDTCDPFGFCQGTLKSVDIGIGVVVRF